MFYYLRSLGASVEQAEDWTQEFLLRVVIDAANIASATQERDHFRNFLRRLLQRFAADQRPARTTRQKAFEQQTLSLTFVLGDEERSWEPAGANPDDEFNWRWAVAVIAQALQQLRQLAANDWPIFEARHLGDGQPPSQETLAQQFGTTRDEVRRALKRTESRFDRLLRAELREEGVGESELDDAISELRRVMARCVG